MNPSLCLNIYFEIQRPATRLDPLLATFQLIEPNVARWIHIGRNRRTFDLREVFSSQHAQTTHCSQKAARSVFSGTSLAVDSWLQPGSDYTNLALISRQSSISLGFAMNNSNPTVREIWTTILWFLSLSLSLSTAFIIILVLQLLRKYQMEFNIIQRTDAFTLWQMRLEILEHRHIPSIMMLPLFLQASLVLFCLGLLDFV